MSYNLTRHDLLQLGDYSLHVYKQCRDHPTPSRPLAPTTRHLSNICQDISDYLTQQKVSTAEYESLLTHGHTCTSALRETETLIHQYLALSSKGKRGFVAESWEKQGGSRVQSGLAGCAVVLAGVKCNIELSEQARVVDAVRLMVGEHEGTSMLGAALQEGDDEAAWRQVVRDLGELGLKEEVVGEYRSLVVSRLEEESGNGGGDGASLSEVSSMRDPSIVATQAGPLDISTKSEIAPIPTVHRDLSASQTGPSDAPTTAMLPETPTVHQDLSAVTTHASSSLVSAPLDAPPQAMDADPPPYEELVNPAMLDIAEHIVTAWHSRDWSDAINSLNLLLESASTGYGVEINCIRAQPSVNLLNHLLGVASSLAGNYVTAKAHFTKNLPRVFHKNIELAEHELVATRWMGDTCALLGQDANALLAYSIAAASIPGHYTLSLAAQQILAEMRYHMPRVRALVSVMEHQGRDPTTIYTTTSLNAKIEVMLKAKKRIDKLPLAFGGRFTNNTMHLDITPERLLHPVEGRGSWPYPHDPFLSVAGAEECYRIMRFHNILHDGSNTSSDSIPYTLKSLHYVTKRDLLWLFNTIRTYLEVHDLRYGEQEDRFFVIIEQVEDKIAFSESLTIEFKMKSLKSNFGFRVSHTENQTRNLPNTGAHGSPADRRTDVGKEFAASLISFLDQADRDDPV